MNNLDPATLRWAIDSLEAFAERTEGVLECSGAALLECNGTDTYYSLRGKAQGARFMAMQFKKELAV